MAESGIQMAYEDVRPAGISMSAHGLGNSSWVTNRAAYVARAAVEDLRASADIGAIARRFHRGVAAATVRAAG